MKNYIEKSDSQPYTQSNFHTDYGAPDNQKQQKVKILLVDDRPENLLALEAVLSHPDNHLVFAHSGEEALKCVLEDDFAVILLDVQMPGLDGFETAKLIKAREKSKDVPILFVTAISQAPKHVLNGYAVGAIDYIFKPFQPEILKRKVEGFVQIYRQNRQIVVQQQLLLKQSREIEKEREVQNKRLEGLVAERTSELETANSQLYLSEKRFRKIFQSSPSLIAIRSTLDWRYIDVNESWLNFTEYAYEEVIGRVENFCSFTVDQTSEAHIDYRKYVDKAVQNVKVTYATKLGETRHGLLSTETIDLQGEKCMIISITDITERANLLKEMARLDRLNLVGEMAAGIAHEIRNPMTTVRGFLQILKTHPTSDYIDLMLEELDRANSIISEFLSLAKSKLVDRKMQLLNPIINALAPLIEAEAVLSGKTIKLKLDECPLLFLDEKEIRQLILNLSLNGLEAMETSGCLCIRTYSREQEVVMEIQDQGSGIDEQLLDKLGTPFLTTKEKGTGLGLAVCYSVATRHGAQIKVKTGSSGTTFSVHFKTANSTVS
jgi:two-component system, sporulation sensor kinase E